MSDRTDNEVARLERQVERLERHLEAFTQLLDAVDMWLWDEQLKDAQ